MRRRVGVSRRSAAALVEKGRSAWTLRGDVVYLNHGSFGACPRDVLEVQREWTARLQADPLDFLARKLAGHLAEARDALGRFVGTSGENLLLIDNATVAMNVVSASVELAPGDEVLTTNHEYGAVTRIWERRCAAAGARLVVARLPDPIDAPQSVVAAIVAATTPRTRLVVVSHVSSPTAIVLPVAEICGACRARGVAVCIDGPHALVMRPLAIDLLDCDFFAATCHKWLCAPIGSGFLYVNPRSQAAVRSPITSWGKTPGETPGNWRDELVWWGTRDPSAALAIPAAIRFIESLGLEAFRSHGHALASAARKRLLAEHGGAPLTPDDPAWYGTMAAIPLPDGDAAALQQALWRRFRIEVPIFDWNGRRLVRVSCHAYNTRGDVERLSAALRDLLRPGQASP
jgi:isopenicillin-N epimerase